MLFDQTSEKETQLELAKKLTFGGDSSSIGTEDSKSESHEDLLVPYERKSLA